MTTAAVAGSTPLPLGAAERREATAAWLLVLPLLAVLALFFVVPLASVLWISFSDPEIGLQNYARLASSEALQRVLWTTLRVSAETTAIAVVLAYVVAYVMVHVGPTHRLWITGFVLVPFWVSVLVRAFAWMTLLRTEGIVNTALTDLGLVSAPLELIRNEFAVVLAMVHYMVPYAVLPLYSAMSGINPLLADASRSLGAGPVRTFASVFLPLSMPGVVSAAILVFIFCLGFMVTPALLGGGKVMMVGEYVRVTIFQTVRWGVGTMMASVLLVTVVGLLLVMSRVVDVKAMFGAR